MYTFANREEHKNRRLFPVDVLLAVLTNANLSLISLLSFNL
jgi:hypothetical protein